MNIKKFTASATVVAMIATQTLMSVSTVKAAYTNPVWESAVSFMKNEGLSSVANSVEEYMPLATVTREQAAKFFVAFAEKEFNKTADTTKVCKFADEFKANPVFKPYIKKACQMGIIKGVDGKFLPKQSLKKHQFLTILARIVKNDPSLNPRAAFALMKSDGITKEGSYEDTVRPVSRIVLAMLFKRAVEKYAQKDNGQQDDSGSDIGTIINGLVGDDDNTNTNNEPTNNEPTNNEPTSTNTTEDDVLSVAVDPATPAEQYVPGTGSHIQVLKFDLTA
jgi:hypothetical protein